MKKILCNDEQFFREFVSKLVSLSKFFKYKQHIFIVLFLLIKKPIFNITKYLTNRLFHLYSIYHSVIENTCKIENKMH